MEETDMCHLTPTARFFQQAIPNGCVAKAFTPSQKLAIGVEALAHRRSKSALARQHHVSRKFVKKQATTAQLALEQAFHPPVVPDDQVLFWLPVTKAWLRQFCLALMLICHSSYRGVVELLRDLFDFHISVGKVHNILKSAVAAARVHNQQQTLENVHMGTHDEIFQIGWPVLVGADVASTYCYLLSRENHRDAETWAIRLLELQDRGFKPEATIGDFGSALRAGQQIAMPQMPCRGDVFHALQELTKVATYLDNRAYKAIKKCDSLQRRQADYQRRKGHANLEFSQILRHARPEEAKAIALADRVTTLVQWLRADLFAVNGLAYEDRCALYDFVVAELQALVPQSSDHLKPVYTLLHDHRDELLAFAAQLETELAEIARKFAVSLATVRHLLDIERLDPRQPERWLQQQALQKQVRGRFHSLRKAVAHVARKAVRASSVIENINSRLRNYFFLRRHLRNDYLELLQFFLNHRCFLRSEHPERVNKSPAELLTGKPHPHWLVMLGYTLFSRN
jgi:hypothetical protein